MYLFISWQQNKFERCSTSVKKNFYYKIKHLTSDNAGSLMLFDLDLGEITLRLINIYAPNVDNPTFLKKKC